MLSLLALQYAHTLSSTCRHPQGRSSSNSRRSISAGACQGSFRHTARLECHTQSRRRRHGQRAR